MSKLEDPSSKHTSLDDPNISEAYARLFPRIYAYVAFRVGQQQDAEDIVSQTFLKAVENLDRFAAKHKDSLDAWLFTIARNLVKNHYRSNSRRGEAHDVNMILLKGKSEAEPDKLLDRKENYLELQQALTTLGSRHQEVIMLKFFGGLRNREIASVLQIQERTVAAYLVRGLKQLQAKYTALGIGSGESIENENT